MYKKFFGLRSSPFNVNPDPRFLFLTRSAQEALVSLAYGIHMRKGFVLLTGEVGTGKTTLLNRLLQWLRQRGVATAFIFNSTVNVPQLLELMTADFGLDCGSTEKSRVLLRLTAWLLERHRSRQTTVLIVDEAQNLSTEVLEEIRLLTNLETSTEKLLQIVLSGQPELREKLRLPELRQLNQRITLRCCTQPLSESELAGYIESRLRMAGATRVIFLPEAARAVYRHTHGIPRLVNILCEHSLISAYVDQQQEVRAATVDHIAIELEMDAIAEVSGSMAPGSGCLVDSSSSSPQKNGQQASESLSNRSANTSTVVRQLSVINEPIRELGPKVALKGGDR